MTNSLDNTVTDVTPEPTDREKTMAAIETCFSLISNAGYSYSQFQAVTAALNFLQSLHDQMKESA